jgi:hypothetical protein
MTKLPDLLLDDAMAAATTLRRETQRTFTAPGRALLARAAQPRRAA